MSNPQITIDLNADVGEGLASDIELMPFISSANIACGYHAGDDYTIRHTMDLCLKYNVAIGAHPSFADRVNFGRTEINLPLDEVKNLVQEQLYLIQKICGEMGATMHHVKPHGALYNMSAHEAKLAQTIAEAVFSFNPSLILFGLSGSHSIAEGVMAGLQTAAEVFADRSYMPDASLTPRSLPKALVTNHEEALNQALRLATENKVVAMDGTVIPIMAETICLHGDGLHAVSFARNIHQTFTGRGITIQAIYKN